MATYLVSIQFPELRLHVSARALPLAGLLLLACTPLGAWVYEDPSFRLTRVEPRYPGASGPAADSFNLVFLACNRNDFDLLLQRVSARLEIPGQNASRAESADHYTLPTRTMSEILVSVALADSMIASDKVHRRFAVAGETTVSTPSGDRVVSWQQHGLVWRAGDSVGWIGEGGVVCRPGLSQLPTHFTRPRLAPPTAEPPPRVLPNPSERP